MSLFMFYGEFVHSIDDKGRIVLPSKFRETAKKKAIKRFFITRGLDKCLFMFPEKEWHIQEVKFRAMSFTKSEARKFNRMYFSGAFEAVADPLGRILLPAYLKDYAGIKKDIVIIGVSSRIEIWNKNTWHKFYKQSLNSFEAVAEKIIPE